MADLRQHSVLCKEDCFGHDAAASGLEYNPSAIRSKRRMGGAQRYPSTRI